MTETVKQRCRGIKQTKIGKNRERVGETDVETKGGI